MDKMHPGTKEASAREYKAVAEPPKSAEAGKTSAAASPEALLRRYDLLRKSLWAAMGAGLLLLIWTVAAFLAEPTAQTRQPASNETETGVQQEPSPDASQPTMTDQPSDEIKTEKQDNPVQQSPSTNVTKQQQPARRAPATNKVQPKPQQTPEQKQPEETQPNEPAQKQPTQMQPEETQPDVPAQKQPYQQQPQQSY